MRVISGTARGCKLITAAGSTVRPTADRVKEAMFNILAPKLVGTVEALDLFAGSGALGIEAVSRGAHSAVFVDNNAKVLAVLRQNLKNCRVSGHATVVRWDIQKNLACLKTFSEHFNLVLMDPPYHQGLVSLALEHLLLSNCLVPGATIVAEHEPDAPIDLPAPRITLTDTRRYGSNQLSFMEFTG